MAVDAQFGLLYGRWMVSLGIEAIGRSQDVPGAIFNTVPAPFAAVLYDMDLPSGNHDFRGVQGNSPEFHVGLLQVND
jgi:hypothetical protein